MVEALERGDISFFFRPRVQPADPTGGFAARPAGRAGRAPTSHLAPLEAPAAAPGVQSFFFVLGTAGDRHRRVRVGRKRMPAAIGERLWARVERVGSLQRVLADQLEAEEYRTKTRGDRYQPGARPIGQGCYAFVRHDDHVHLVYRLALVEPDIPDEVRIAEAGNDLVLFKRSEMGDGIERDPRGRALWATAGEPALLDEEGAELVIVGTGADDDLGVDVLGPASAPGGPSPGAGAGPAADRVA